MMQGPATPAMLVTQSELPKYRLLGGSILRVVLLSQAEAEERGIESNLPTPLYVVNDVLEVFANSDRSIEGGEPLPFYVVPGKVSPVSLIAIPVYVMEE